MLLLWITRLIYNLMIFLQKAERIFSHKIVRKDSQEVGFFSISQV